MLDLGKAGPKDNGNHALQATTYTAWHVGLAQEVQYVAQRSDR